VRYFKVKKFRFTTTESKHRDEKRQYQSFGFQEFDDAASNVLTFKCRVYHTALETAENLTRSAQIHHPTFSMFFRQII
jgi:hypothetical protein